MHRKRKHKTCTDQLPISWLHTHENYHCSVLSDYRTILIRGRTLVCTSIPTLAALRYTGTLRKLFWCLHYGSVYRSQFTSLCFALTHFSIHENSSFLGRNVNQGWSVPTQAAHSHMDDTILFVSHLRLNFPMLVIIFTKYRLVLLAFHNLLDCRTRKRINAFKLLRVLLMTR